MVNAEFKSYGSYTTDSANQWDLNQQLTISGLAVNAAPVLVFACHGMRDGIIVQSTISDGIISCDVPNAILQFGKDIVVNICEDTHETYRSIERFTIPIVRRAKPADYFYTDNVPILTYESLVNLITVERTRIDNIVVEKSLSSNFTYKIVEKTSIFDSSNNGEVTHSFSTEFDIPTEIADKDMFIIHSFLTVGVRKTSQTTTGGRVDHDTYDNAMSVNTAAYIKNGKFGCSGHVTGTLDNGENVVKYTIIVGYPAEVEENAEIVDARLGHNGMSYKSLGAHIRYIDDAVADLEDRVKALENK